MMGVDKINRPDIDGEMEEIQRVTQYLNKHEGFHTNVSEVISSFDKSIEVTIPEDVWSNLENTESNQIEQGDMESVYKIADTYDKSNPDKLTEKLKDGSSPKVKTLTKRLGSFLYDQSIASGEAIGMPFMSI